MALWILLNTVKFASSGVGAAIPTLLEAGKTIDDTKYNLTAIKAAGGVVVPSTDAGAAAAAVIAKYLRAGGQGDQSPATLLDLTMVAAIAGEANASQATRLRSTATAGGTVAAAAAIVPAIAFAPTFSGKLHVRAWVSFAALASGIVTPVLKQGSTVKAAAAPSSGTGGPLNTYLEVEVTGLTVGTPVTFNFTTTAGDATATLGTGSTGISASMEIVERP
jgi:hypothetical protein